MTTTQLKLQLWHTQLKRTVIRVTLPVVLALSFTILSTTSWADLQTLAPDSLNLEPVRVDAQSRDGLRLALKRYARPGAQPVMLVHGLAQNDRGWDPGDARYSFARYLHSQGFDVWVANFRNAGTQGFRSEAPKGAHHWSIDDYAISDLPGLIEGVLRETGQAPFVVGHSMAAWVIEGYLAGISYDQRGRVISTLRIGLARQKNIRGVITIAGVYNLRWDHAVSEVGSNPIRNIVDYYHSNYELELLSGFKPFQHIVPHLPELPLGWIGQVINLPFDKIPFVGSLLSKAYRGFQSDVIRTPILNMLYYSPGVDPELVRLHAIDGLEDLGPHVIEQLSNAINQQSTLSYFHISRPQDAYEYSSIRPHVQIPMLFVGGGRDRLASATQIYEDGYLRTQSPDKEYLHVEEFGHMDILTGVHAPEAVMAPVARWIRQRM